MGSESNPLSESRGRDKDQITIARTDEVKQIRKDRVSNQELFIGRALAQDTATSDALWQIQRITAQGSGDEVKEFIAKGAYTQIWDDRGSLFTPFTPGTKIVGETPVDQSFNLNAQVVADTVTTVASQIDTTPLAGRKKIYIQNLGNQSVFLGFTSGVTTLTGLEIPKGFILDDFFGESIPLFLIAPAGVQAIRFLEVG